MKEKFKHWSETSGVRLALIIAITTTALLVAVNLIVSYREQNTFVSAVASIPTARAPYSQLNSNLYLPGEPKRIENLKTPRELFEDHLHIDLMWVTGVGILLSIVIGLVLAQQFFTKPLSRLQNAIKRLKKRDFETKVDPTGLTEFDEVVHEFNGLVHELARAENLRRDLISDTSHELNTPITALRAQLEGMRDGLIPLEKDRVTLLLTQVDRLSDLTGRLQEYTRLRNRTASLHQDDIHLSVFLGAIAKEVQPELEKHKITLTLEVPEDIHILADTRLLEELFHNFLQNTLAYAKASRITIAYRQGKLYFADNGIGVPEEALPNLFERFYRVENSRNRKTGGLGLGLAIVKEIADAHNWALKVELLKPTGLVFILTVPQLGLEPAPEAQV